MAALLLTGCGTDTANGYILYQFTIEAEDNEIVTTQYYIIGE